MSEIKTTAEMWNMVRQYDKDADPKKKEFLLHEGLIPLKSKIGMVLTSHSGHLLFLKYVLQQLRQIDDMFIIGAYDPRFVNPDRQRNHIYIPWPDIWELAHMWIFKHRTWTGFSKRHGWNWLHIYSSSILRQFENIEYIVSGNGDCVWENPQGIYELIDDVLGDNDFMAGQSHTREKDGFNFIHTCSMIFKREAYFSFIDFMINSIKNPDSPDMKGLKDIEMAGISPESLMNRWVHKYDIKWKHAPIQPRYPDGTIDEYCEYGGESTWKNVIGFRNLNAEKNYRCFHHMDPLEKKFFDVSRDPQLYMDDHDKNTLYKYYTTGDVRYLRMWDDQSPWLPRPERIKRMKKSLSDYGD